MTNLRRFWKTASVAPHTDGHAILLDGKIALTPARAVLASRHDRLVAAISDEWNAAPDKIDPRDMPLTGYLNAVIDRVSAHRASMAADIAKFAGHELICYRADSPGDLVARQDASWNPVLEWLRARFDVVLNVRAGVMHIDQPADSLARLSDAVNALDPYRLTAAIKLAGMFKSLALTLAVLERQMSAAEAHDLSRLDEIYQAERWGEDQRAKIRIDKEKVEIVILCRFLSLLD